MAIKEALIGLLGAVIGAGGSWYWSSQQYQETVRKNNFDIQQVRREKNAAEQKAAEAVRDRDRWTSQIKDVAGKFTDQMDRLIIDLQRALDLSRRAPNDGDPQLISAARAVTAARDDFAVILQNITENTNKEFSGVANALTSGRPDIEELRRASGALIGAWPAKKEKLKGSISIFLTRLGF